MATLPTWKEVIRHYLTEGHKPWRNRQGNLYSQGGVLYSYGPHYPLARFVLSHNDSRPYLLVNANKSSRTTEKHKAELARQSLHRPVIFVPAIRSPLDHNANLDWFTKTINTLSARARRSRSRKADLSVKLYALITQAITYRSIFNLPTMLPTETPDTEPTSLFDSRP